MQDLPCLVSCISYLISSGGVILELQVCNIKKRFGRQQVLSDIHFSAQSGCCIGILGANGSGKSTLLSILAGILPPDGGSVLLDGEDLLKNTALRRQAVGYVPQLTPLIPELTAKDNLLLWYTPRELRRELEGGVLSLLGIGEFLNKRVSALSGGMKKRLSIGCAIHGRPPVLLLDEPTAALDLRCRQEIAGYLDAYRRSGGILLLTTHEESELKLCDRWLILKDGVLTPYVYDGNLTDLVEKL